MPAGHPPSLPLLLPLHPRSMECAEDGNGPLPLATSSPPHDISASCVAIGPQPDLPSLDGLAVAPLSSVAHTTSITGIVSLLKELQAVGTPTGDPRLKVVMNYCRHNYKTVPELLHLVHGSVELQTLLLVSVLLPNFQLMLSARDATIEAIETYQDYVVQLNEELVARMGRTDIGLQKRVEMLIASVPRFTQALQEYNLSKAPRRKQFWGSKTGKLRSSRKEQIIVGLWGPDWRNAFDRLNPQGCSWKWNTGPEFLRTIGFMAQQTRYPEVAAAAWFAVYNERIRNATVQTIDRPTQGDLNNTISVLQGNHPTLSPALLDLPGIEREARGPFPSIEEDRSPREAGREISAGWIDAELFEKSSSTEPVGVVHSAPVPRTAGGPVGALTRMTTGRVDYHNTDVARALVPPRGNMAENSGINREEGYTVGEAEADRLVSTGEQPLLGNLPDHDDEVEERNLGGRENSPDYGYEQEKDNTEKDNYQHGGEEEEQGKGEENRHEEDKSLGHTDEEEEVRDEDGEGSHEDKDEESSSEHSSAEEYSNEAIEECKVAALLGHKVEDGKTWYKVFWGQHRKSETWEAEENLVNYQELLRKYEELGPQKKPPRRCKVKKRNEPQQPIAAASKARRRSTHVVSATTADSSPEPEQRWSPEKTGQYIITLMRYNYDISSLDKEALEELYVKIENNELADEIPRGLFSDDELSDEESTDGGDESANPASFLTVSGGSRKRHAEDEMEQHERKRRLLDALSRRTSVFDFDKDHGRLIYVGGPSLVDFYNKGKVRPDLMNALLRLLKVRCRQRLERRHEAVKSCRDAIEIVDVVEWGRIAALKQQEQVSILRKLFVWKRHEKAPLRILIPIFISQTWVLGVIKDMDKDLITITWLVHVSLDDNADKLIFDNHARFAEHWATSQAVINRALTIDRSPKFHQNRPIHWHHGSVAVTGLDALENARAITDWVGRNATWSGDAGWSVDDAVADADASVAGAGIFTAHSIFVDDEKKLRAEEVEAATEAVQGMWWSYMKTLRSDAPRPRRPLQTAHT